MPPTLAGLVAGRLAALTPEQRRVVPVAVAAQITRDAVLAAMFPPNGPRSRGGWPSCCNAGVDPAATPAPPSCWRRSATEVPCAAPNISVEVTALALTIRGLPHLLANDLPTASRLVDAGMTALIGQRQAIPVYFWGLWALLEAGDQELAEPHWWRRLLRLLVLAAAVADGWGDPVPALRADLAAHVAHLLDKTGATNRVELRTIATRNR